MAKGMKTGGRVKGTPNKATADIKALAMEYAPDAMKRLYEIATRSESDAASVAAIKELLDRGFGKARQAIDAEVSGPNGQPIQSQVQLDVTELTNEQLRALSAIKVDR